MNERKETKDGFEFRCENQRMATAIEAKKRRRRENSSREREKSKEKRKTSAWMNDRMHSNRSLSLSFEIIEDEGGSPSISVIIWFLFIELIRHQKNEDEYAIGDLFHHSLDANRRWKLFVPDALSPPSLLLVHRGSCHILQ